MLWTVVLILLILWLLGAFGGIGGFGNNAHWLLVPEISSPRLAVMVIATVILFIIAAIFCTGCQTPPTPEQINAYSQAAHTAVQDFKSVAPVKHH